MEQWVVAEHHSDGHDEKLAEQQPQPPVRHARPEQVVHLLVPLPDTVLRVGLSGVASTLRAQLLVGVDVRPVPPDDQREGDGNTDRVEHEACGGIRRQRRLNGAALTIPKFDSQQPQVLENEPVRE